MNKQHLVFNGIIEKSQQTSRWLAVCLELNIVVEGETREKASAALSDAIQMYIESVFEEGDYTSLLRPAPQEYWQKLHAMQAGSKGKPPIAELNLVTCGQ